MGSTIISKLNADKHSKLISLLSLHLLLNEGLDTLRLCDNEPSSTAQRINSFIKLLGSNKKLVNQHQEDDGFQLFKKELGIYGDKIFSWAEDRKLSYLAALTSYGHRFIW